MTASHPQFVLTSNKMRIQPKTQTLGAKANKCTSHDADHTRTHAHRHKKEDMWADKHINPWKLNNTHTHTERHFKQRLIRQPAEREGEGMFNSFGLQNTAHAALLKIWMLYSRHLCVCFLSHLSSRQWCQLGRYFFQQAIWRIRFLFQFNVESL